MTTTATAPLPLIGYADRLSVRPGETIAFKVSSRGAAPFTASLTRIVCGDPNPDGPGLQSVDCSAQFNGHFPSRAQDCTLGSHALVPIPGSVTLESFTVLATIWPTLPDDGPQAVLSWLDEPAGSGFELRAGGSGGITLQLALEGGEFFTLASGVALAPRHWYRVWAAYDAASGELHVGQRRLDRPAAGAARSALLPRAPCLHPQPRDLALAATRDAQAHFNGKIESPQLFDRCLSADAVLGQGLDPTAPGLIAAWDFSRSIPTERIEDIGPLGLDGRLVNLPTRAVTGSGWRGREMSWRHAPEDYAAIYFHDDDLYDCGWETDFTFTLPDDLPSGAYAMRLGCEGAEDSIPFFVPAPRGRPGAPLCVVLPTFTYLAYANNARYDFGPELKRRMREWGGYPWNPAEHPDYGLCTYNLHSDGSGICYASARRPLLTLRPGYLTLAPPGSGSGLRHFQADTHLLAWLEAKGLAYDVVTDHELHAEGTAALAPYRAVLTATHPEYHTERSLDAFQGYLQGGGRMAYLGGNGFYWRVAFSEEIPDVLEIRRGEGGLRTWAAEPGEYYHALDGTYGGLWRRNGRPPQALVGVGFSAQGTFLGSYYRRTPASRTPRFAWLFEGIEGETIGDFGLCGGGAAGYELDRVDPLLGSPEGTVVLARSEGHGPTYIAAPEEILSHVSTVNGEPAADLVRAEIGWFDTPQGGAVFSVGSITFCGSLPCNGFENDISRLLGNVVNRFLADSSPP